MLTVAKPWQIIMLGGEAVADGNFGNIISDIALLTALGKNCSRSRGKTADQPIARQARLPYALSQE